jgi:hypothetical protein
LRARASDDILTPEDFRARLVRGREVTASSTDADLEVLCGEGGEGMEGGTPEGNRIFSASYTSALIQPTR